MACDQTNLQPFVGRRCVYIESGTLCIAHVLSVATTDEAMSAVLGHVPEAPLVWRLADRSFENGAPFGEQWLVSKRWDAFFSTDDYWDGSIYLGFRILFAPAVIEKFSRDLSWMEDYF